MELEAAGSRALCVTADLSAERGIEHTLREALPLNPVAAVFNAGLSYSGRFATMPKERRTSLLALNIVGTTELLSRFVAHFVATGERRGILIISSLAGETTLPTQAVYAASKAYLTSLARGLAHELSSTATSVGVLLPGGVDTDMAHQSGMKQNWIVRTALVQPGESAKAAAEALLRGRTLTVPGALNKVTAALAKLLPHSLTTRMAALPYDA